MSKRTNQTAARVMKLAHSIKSQFATFSAALKTAWAQIKNPITVIAETRVYKKFSDGSYEWFATPRKTKDGKWGAGVSKKYTAFAPEAGEKITITAKSGEKRTGIVEKFDHSDCYDYIVAII